MTQLPSWVPESYTAKVRGVEYPIDGIHDLNETALRKVFEYGLQRISNDSAASAKTDDDAIALADKRWDNLRAGVIRAAGLRVGDPVKRRAMELAESAVKTAPKYVAWLQAAGIKANDKAAVAKRRELAEKFVPNYMAQAKIDVESAKALPALEIDEI